MRDISPISSVSRAVSALSLALLAMLFLSAAIQKGIDAPAFRGVIGDLFTAWWPGDGQLPSFIHYPGVAIATTIVITCEVVVGSMLLVPGLARAGLRFAAGMLVVFLLILVSMLFIPEPPSCGCFGGAGTSSANARTDVVLGIVRNGSLIVLATWMLRCAALPTEAPTEAVAEARCA